MRVLDDPDPTSLTRRLHSGFIVRARGCILHVYVYYMYSIEQLQNVIMKYM